MHKIYCDHFYNLGSGRELCAHSEALSPWKTAKKHLILVIRGRFCEEPVDRGPSPCLVCSWGISLAAGTGDVRG